MADFREINGVLQNMDHVAQVVKSEGHPSEAKLYCIELHWNILNGDSGQVFTITSHYFTDTNQRDGVYDYIMTGL